MNPLVKGFILGLVSSFVGHMVFEYTKHSINKQRVMHNREPLGAFERGSWYYLPNGTAVWVPESGNGTTVVPQ